MELGRLKFSAAVGCAGALATIAAACAGSGTHTSSAGAAPASTGPTTSPPQAAASTPSAAASTAVVERTSPKYGRFLTTSAGFALYTYTADDPGGPGCTGECLKIWPPLLLAPGQTAAGAGVSGLGAFHRGSRLQVTFHGLPLYTFVKDTAPGQVTGQDVTDPGGKWVLAVVSAPPGVTSTTGGAVAPTSPATTPSTTAPSSGGASF